MSETVEMADNPEVEWDFSRLPEGWMAVIHTDSDRRCWWAFFDQQGSPFMRSNKYNLTDTPEWVESQMRTTLGAHINQIANYAQNVERLGL